MSRESIKQAIRDILERYVFKSPSEFLLEDYNNFEKEMWELKNKYNLNESPFLLLPGPAMEADFKMMNATNDGFTEPNMEAKKEYLAAMKKVYERLKN